MLCEQEENMKITVTTKKHTTEFYPKREVLTAIKWYYGVSAKVAEKVYKKFDTANHNTLTYWYRMIGAPRFKTDLTVLEPFPEVNFFQEGSSI